LRVLEIGKNPLVEIKDYKKKVREILPQLDLVDGKDKDGISVHSDDEEYANGGSVSSVSLS
jgi:hypothetical protein